MKSRNFAIIGLGAFGGSVARELTRMGDAVLGIDSDGKLVASLNHELENTIEADGTDINALADCGIENYDAVIISIGENIEASILSAMNVLELGCNNIWVKALNETQAKILRAIGIENVVLPEQSYGHYIAQIIHNPMVKDYLSFGDGKYLTEMTIEAASVKRVFGDKKTLSQYNLKCIGFYIEGDFLPIEDYDGPLNEDLNVLIFGSRSDIRKFVDFIS